MPKGHTIPEEGLEEGPESCPELFSHIAIMTNVTYGYLIVKEGHRGVEVYTTCLWVWGKGRYTSQVLIPVWVWGKDNIQYSGWILGKDGHTV